MKKRMELPQKMRFKILVLCLACTMTALLLQTWLFNRKSSTLIYNQAKKESFSLLQNMQDDLFTILKSMENNIIKVYNRQQLIRDLKEKESISLLRDKYYSCLLYTSYHVHHPRLHRRSDDSGRTTQKRRFKKSKSRRS